MWQVTFTTDDKRLPKALRALAGIAFGTPSVVPLSGAKAKGGKLVEDQLSPEDIVAKLPEFFTVAQLNGVLKDAALSTMGIHQRLVSYMRRKLIKRAGRGKYRKIVK